MYNPWQAHRALPGEAQKIKDEPRRGDAVKNAQNICIFTKHILPLHQQNKINTPTMKKITFAMKWHEILKPYSEDIRRRDSLRHNRQPLWHCIEIFSTFAIAHGAQCAFGHDKITNETERARHIPAMLHHAPLARVMLFSGVDPEVQPPCRLYPCCVRNNCVRASV